MPFRCQIGELAVIQAEIVFCPALLTEGIVPSFLPEVGVVGGEAGEHQYP